MTNIIANHTTINDVLPGFQPPVHVGLIRAINHAHVGVGSFGTHLIVSGQTYVGNGSSLIFDGADHNNGAAGFEDDGSVVVTGGSLLSAARILGNTSVSVSGGSVLKLDASPTSETIQLNNSELYIGGAHGTKPIGFIPSTNPQPGDPQETAGFLGHIILKGASEVIVGDTTASSMYYLSTIGFTAFFDGPRNPVGSLNITSDTHKLYGSMLSGDQWGPELVLRTTPGPHDIASFSA